MAELQASVAEDPCGKACLTDQLSRWFGCRLDVLISVQHPCQTLRPDAREVRHQSSLSPSPGLPAGKVAHDLSWVGQIPGQEAASRAELPVRTGLAPAIVLVSSPSCLCRLLSRANVNGLRLQHA